MRAAIPSVIVLAVISAVAFLHHWSREPQHVAADPIPVVIAATPAPEKPEPFAYAEAVMPSYIPIPKRRPRHHRHRIVCK